MDGGIIFKHGWGGYSQIVLGERENAWWAQSLARCVLLIMLLRITVVNCTELSPADRAVLHSCFMVHLS